MDKVYILCACGNVGGQFENYKPKYFCNRKDAEKALQEDYDRECDCEQSYIYDSSINVESGYYEIIFTDDTFVESEIFEIDLADQKGDE